MCFSPLELQYWGTSPEFDGLPTKNGDFLVSYAK